MVQPTETKKKTKGRLRLGRAVNKKYLGLVYPIERTLQAGQQLDIDIFANAV